MTDLPLPAKNHGLSVIDSVAANGLSSANPPLSSTLFAPGPEEEEDYTIKCICGFLDDDGNTVFCERCGTWQHTQCYYFENGEVPDVSEVEHWCKDCEPRRVDARAATERQTLRREESDLGERKIKKPPPKSHKRKTKASEQSITLVNGLPSYDRHDHYYTPERAAGSPKDHGPSNKRPKANHRYSASLQSPQIPHGANEKRSGSTSRTIRSPPKTPGKYPSNGCLAEPYSHEFMRLYDNDPGDAPMQANLFNDITITRSLSRWTHDPDDLADASNGLSPQEVFHRCNEPLDSMDLPVLCKSYRQGNTTDADGRHPQWTLLTTDTPLVNGSIVGELKGKIGHMHEYVQDPANRWEHLRHPVPFVFFHPKLPIYIDTRREGTRCRYLRRSCRPNLKMTTILENGSDYRFCFVATEDLDAGSELTVGWTLDEHIRSLLYRRNSENFKHEGINDVEKDYLSDWVGKVLADFGVCACESPAECSLARYDHRFSSPLNGTFKLSNSNVPKGRNASANRHSVGTDHAMNGRSHQVKQQDEDDDDHSSSASSNSKQRSRDNTPTQTSASENAFAIGEEVSERDKRKIAAAEKNFEQIEYEKGQPGQKKKKRSSGGTSGQVSATPAPRQPGFWPFSQPNTPGAAPRSQHTEFGTSRLKSDSPGGKQASVSATNQGKLSGRRKRTAHVAPISEVNTADRPDYVSTSVQTDVDDRDDWYDVPKQERTPKPYMSLSKQLLLRAQRAREKTEQRIQAENSRSAMQSSVVHQMKDSSIAPGFSGVDTEMQEVDYSSGQTAEAAAISSPVQKPRPPDAADARVEATNTQSMSPPALESSARNPTRGLRVQLPAPQLGPDALSGSPKDIVQSPIAQRPPFIQTPGTYPPLFTPASSLVQPSPVKKKVSLGEYMSRRREPSSSSGEKPSNNSPVLSHGPPKPLDGIEEARSVAGGEDTTMVDSPRGKDGTSLPDSTPIPTG
ncbi:MAG: hypothetical protein Q9174_000583 [Haloplaca sp. 1 TL-2023]